MIKRHKPNKTLILGSGALQIGQVVKSNRIGFVINLIKV